MPVNATTLSVNPDTVNEAISRHRPSEDAHAVSPSDSADLTPYATKLYVGGAGNVKVTTLAGTTLTFTGVPAGTVLPVTVKRVFNTGTTASSIVALHD